MEHYRLDNGLTVILVPHRLAPVVAMQAWVGVGSADEAAGQAGISHVFEHMLFKGTARRGVGEIARTVEAAGGEINAWTSFDQTVYHVVLASRYLHVGLDVLADALQNASFDPAELEREREVILEELRQGRDDPMRTMVQALFTAAFAGHPYGRPIIGSPDTVRGLGRSHLLHYFRRWYVASNVTLVVAGDFDPAATRRAITSSLGAMRSAPIARRARRRARPLAVPRQPRVAIETRDVGEAYVAVGFHIPPLLSPALAALDVAAVALGQGESSRLVSRLRRERELCTGIHAYAHSLRDAGLLVVSATARPDRLHDTVQAACAETLRLAVDELSAAELDKARRIVEADMIYRRETAQGVARKHGYYHATAGDPAFESAYLERVRALTPASVRAAAARYLVPEAATIAAVLPAASLSDRGARAKAAAAQERQLVARLRRGAQQAARRAPARARRAGHAHLPGLAVKRERTPDGAIVRAVLPSGMRVIIKQDPSVPVVAMRATWTGGVRLETAANSGITHLLARLITRGCQGMSAEALIAKVDDMAGSLKGVSGRNSFGLRAEWLARSFPEGLDIVARCILAPELDADELAREQRRIIDDLRAREDSPSFVAFRLFARTLYRKHPYGLDVAGTRESIASLGRDDVAAFYRDHYPLSELTLAIVGDVDADDALARVRTLFGREPARERSPRPVPQDRFTGRPARTREVYGFLDRQQAHLIIGFPGTTLDDPDRYSLEVLTTILGGQGGRLFVELRERLAIAYSVGAVSVEGIDPGYLAVYLACSPDKLAAAIASIRDQLERIATEPVSRAELERARRYLIGTHEISLQRRSAVAGALAFHESYGLGYREYQRYAAAIRAVSAADVRRVAATYIDWDVAVTATVRPPERTPGVERRIGGGKRRIEQRGPRTR